MPFDVAQGTARCKVFTVSKAAFGGRIELWISKGC